MKSKTSKTKRSACPLCSRNCGIKVHYSEEGKIDKISGDSNHPISQGYVCQKALRLQYYQSHSDRLTRPLKKMPSGEQVEISWDQAISEISDRLRELREKHGGRSIATYMSGQGNHLGGMGLSALREVLGTRYNYNALAQEKTGDAWVNGKLFGRESCHIAEDLEHADLILFIGTNPWQSHGIPNARKNLREWSKNPKKRMVTIDPRRTETADLSDLHLQLRPGTDVYLLSGLLAILFQSGLVDEDFLAERCTGDKEVRALFDDVDPKAFAERAGIGFEDLEQLARWMGEAESCSVRVDLGIQQSRNSTVNSYLEKLLFLITGNFGRRGGNNLHSWFVPIVGHSGPRIDPDRRDLRRSWKTSVNGAIEIAGLFPPNVMPSEIDTDHPERLRGLIIQNGNPVTTGADSQAYRQAFSKLELLVVLDVTHTETTRFAHYVLPAASQFEKWEATFFNMEFPINFFHLRAPVFAPLGESLPESEIFRRLCTQLDASLRGSALMKLAARCPRWLGGSQIYLLTLMQWLKKNRSYKNRTIITILNTLGTALKNLEHSAIWLSSQLYFRENKKAVARIGIRSGNQLFDRILDGPSGTIISEHEYEDSFRWLKHSDGRIHLWIDELAEKIRSLLVEAVPGVDREYPLNLIAGERRSYNANSIYRDPKWRRDDAEGALRIYPSDAEDLQLKTGDWVDCSTRRGSIKVMIKECDTMLPGVVSLPHGYGYQLTGLGTDPREVGPSINEITDWKECDAVAWTPHYKNVAVRLSKTLDHRI